MDPDGKESVRQAWGIDEPQGFWSAFGRNFAYNAWNTISFGALGRQDKLVEKYEAGQISEAQYWGRTAINAGASTAMAVATISTAGAATAATTGAVAAAGVSSPLAAGVLGGGITGAGYGLALQGANDALEVAGTGTKLASEVRAGDYGRAAGLGFLLGMAPGGAQSLAAAEAAAASAPRATTIVETAPPPKALAAGSQPRALIGAGEPGAPVGGSPGVRFIADASGNIQDLAATARGNLNPIGRQGPIALTAGELAGVPRWKLYEMRFGGRQTPMETTFGGRTVKVRLDKPPESSRIIDFKDYNWSNPKYNQRFFRNVVIPRDFSQQIAKYQTIQPNVHMQFSQEPPAWVVDILTKAGATYSVIP